MAGPNSNLSGLRPLRPILRYPLDEDTLDVLDVADKPKPYWNEEQLLDDVLNCPEGKDALERAAAALGGGTLPIIIPQVPQNGGSAESDAETGLISINPRLDRVRAAQSAIFELNNISYRDRFRDINARSARGEISREEYPRAISSVEFSGVSVVDRAFKSCGSSWGASPGQKGSYDTLSHAKDADDLYDHYLAESNKEDYRKMWDEHFKAAYEEAQNSSLWKRLNPFR